MTSLMYGEDFDMDCAEYSSYEYELSQGSESSSQEGLQSEQSEPIEDESQPTNIQIAEQSIAFCTDVEEAKTLVRRTFGSISKRTKDRKYNGIIVLPLDDITLIRKDTRNRRKAKMLVVVPGFEGFNDAHPDFAQAINILNSA